jgi:hypothetical protein
MSILADAPWKIANPLLMEIGEQLRHQATMKPQDIRVDANGQEASHGQ